MNLRIAGTLTLTTICLTISTLASPYSCYRLSQPPKLDGRLDEDAWKGVPEAGGVYFADSGTEAAARPTFFRMGWTPDAIHLAVRCREPDLNALRTVADKQGPMWADDSVEVCMVAPHAQIHYIANSAGARWQGKWRSVWAGMPLGEWRVATSRGAGEWILELTIPFTDFVALPAPPKDGDRWPFTLARYISSRTGEGNVPVPVGYVSDYDTVVFRDQTFGSKETMEIDKSLPNGRRDNPVFAALMRDAASRMRVGDMCGAKRAAETAYGVATGVEERARSALVLGNTLYEIGARLPGEGASLPNRAYARAVYASVVGMTNACDEIRAQAQYGVLRSVYNVCEYTDRQGLRTACEILLNMKAVEPAAQIEALRIRVATDMVDVRLASALKWCARYRERTDLTPAQRKDAEVRWQLLSNWERMRKTPRAEFNTDYIGKSIDPAVTNILPSIRWATPSGRAPIRMLAMCPLDGIREIAEVVQRMDVIPLIVTTGSREAFGFEGSGERYPAYYATGAPGFRSPRNRKISEAIEGALEQSYDVMLLAGINWSTIPVSIQTRILRKIKEGTPLILQVSHPDATLAAAMTNPVPSDLNFVYPYRGLPAFTECPSQSVWWESVVKRYRHGIGEIWNLNGFDPPEYQVLTPGTAESGADIKLVEYDYYLAFIIHLIHEAADIRMPVRITEKKESLIFHVESDVQTNVTCVWTVRDRNNRIHDARTEAVTLKPGKNMVAYASSVPEAGECFVDLWVRDGDNILDFGSTYIGTGDTRPLHDKGGAHSYLVEYLRAGYTRAGVGKVLNNFVTELVNVTNEEKVKEASFEFVNPRDGWILVRVTTVHGKTADGVVWVGIGPEGEEQAVFDRDVVKSRESMRHLDAGVYRIAVQERGEAQWSRLVVRSIPELVYSPYPNNVITGRRLPSIDWDFLKRTVLPHVNTILSPGLMRDNLISPPVKEAIEWKQRGGRWIAGGTVPDFSHTRPIPAVDEVYRYWTVSDLPMGYVDAISTDEFTHGQFPLQWEKFELFCDALARIRANPAFEGKVVYPYLGLGNARFFKSVFRRVAGLGYKMLTERYAYEVATREEAVRMSEQFYDLDMVPFLEVNPQPQRHMLHFYSPAMLCGGFSVDTRPDVNFKVFLDIQFNTMANAPACAGLYGIGPWTCVYADEETIRWMGKLYRHYCLEGRRDMLSTDPYELRHIVNADFADDLTGWTADAAADGAIRAVSFPNLSRLEGRSYIGDLPGADECVMMRRSDKAPNRLIQTVRRLEPGRTYSVSFCTYDGKHKDPMDRHAVKVKIAGGEIIPETQIQIILEQLNWHYVVFRAQAETAELTLSDWYTEDTPGGRVGQELLYDFIQIQPYLEEQESTDDYKVN